MSIKAPDFDFLLSLSRPEIDQGLGKRVIALGSDISDWPALATKARNQMIGALIYEHLSGLPDAPWLDKARAALQPIAYRQLTRSLRHVAVQREFIEQHLMPNDVFFAVVKGRALAERYYAKPWTRTARDIDIWMQASQMSTVVHSAQDQGFLIYPYGRPLNQSELMTHLRLGQGVALYNKHRVLIELDSRLDKSLNIFTFANHQARFQRQNVDGLNINVLSTTDLFIYICLHHTRHRWSKLIWIADVHALIGAPDFDRREILDEAERLGVLNTVEVVLSAVDGCQSPTLRLSEHGDERVAEMLNDCLHSFYGEGKPSNRWPKRPQCADFSYSWQFSSMHPQPTWFQELRRLYAPNMNDLRILMLPANFFFLYYILKPLFVLFRRGSRQLKRLAVIG